MPTKRDVVKAIHRDAQEALDEENAKGELAEGAKVATILLSSIAMALGIDPRREDAKPLDETLGKIGELYDDVEATEGLLKKLRRLAHQYAVNSDAQAFADAVVKVIDDFNPDYAREEAAQPGEGLVQ